MALAGVVTMTGSVLTLSTEIDTLAQSIYLEIDSGASESVYISDDPLMSSGDGFELKVGAVLGIELSQGRIQDYYIIGTAADKVRWLANK